MFILVVCCSHQSFCIFPLWTAFYWSAGYSKVRSGSWHLNTEQCQRQIFLWEWQQKRSEQLHTATQSSWSKQNTLSHSGHTILMGQCSTECIPLKSHQIKATVLITRLQVCLERTWLGAMNTIEVWCWIPVLLCWKRWKEYGMWLLRLVGRAASAGHCGTMTFTEKDHLSIERVHIILHVIWKLKIYFSPEFSQTCWLI